MASIPGYIWVGGIEGHKAPVPKECPMCGRPTYRTGNRHHREVACKGRLQFVGEGLYRPRECEWNKPVYHGNPTEEDQ